MLDLNAAERLKTALEEVELAEILVAGALVLAHLFLDAKEASAGVLGCGAGGIELVFGADEA